MPVVEAELRPKKAQFHLRTADSILTEIAERLGDAEPNSSAARAIVLATRLIKEAGFEPVLIGGLAKGKYLVPGTPLAGQHTPADLRRIAATLS